MRTFLLALATAGLIAPQAAAQGRGVLTLCGEAHNVTGGGRSSVEVEIDSQWSDFTMISVQWPDEGLYGRLDGPMTRITECRPDRFCAEFGGVFAGLEALGYSMLTNGQGRVALDMARDGSEARAVYWLGPIEGFTDFEQFGVLELGACTGIS